MSKEQNREPQTAAQEVELLETLKQKATNSEKILSIGEAADHHNVTRQAIYVAIKLNKLKAEKVHSRWVIREKDLAEYRNYRYCRTRSLFKGEPLFDNDKGYFSVNQASKRLGIPTQKVYYATRAGLLKGTRKGAAWVFHEDALNEYKTSYLDRVPARRKAG